MKDSFIKLITKECFLKGEKVMACNEELIHFLLLYSLFITKGLETSVLKLMWKILIFYSKGNFFFFKRKISS